MFECGLVSVSFRRLFPAEIIDATTSAGLDCIEWGADVHLPPADIALARKISESMAVAGLRVSSYGSYFRIGVTPTEQFAVVLATASALGAPIIRVWAYDRYLPECKGNTWDAIVSECRKIAIMASEHGVTVCLECHNNTLTQDYHGALALMQAVDHPAFRMYWQPNELRDHAYNLEAARALAPYVECIHVFHWDDKHHYPLIEGRNDWIAYLKIFYERYPEKKFPLLLEFMPDNQVQSLPVEANSLRSIIGIPELT